MFALALVLTLAAAPLEGRGGISTEIRKVEVDSRKAPIAARAIDVAGPFRVRLVPGDPAFVEITGEANLLSHVTISQEKDTIVVRSDVDIASQRGVQVVVHLPVLERVKVAGQVELTAEMRADSVTVVASGASSLLLSGKANNARFEIKGAGKVVATDLAADDVIVVVAGASDVAVAAKKTLTIEGSGVARVRVKGKPAITNTAAPTVSVGDAP